MSKNVLIFGNDYFGKRVALIYQTAGCQTCFGKLNSRLNKLRFLRDMLWCDTIYAVSGMDISGLKLFRLAALLKKKIIIHWIGTDVVIFTEQFRKDHKVLNAGIPHIDLACAEHLVQELAEIGIHASYVPLQTDNLDFQIEPAPEKHMVLSYAPKHRETFYGIEKLRALAERHPDVPFCIVGNDGESDTQKLPNIQYLGWVDHEEMLALLKKCSVVIRYPDHDALGGTAIEAMALGRKVIHRYPLPSAIVPEEDSIDGLDAALQKILNVPPATNPEGAEYVKREFSTENILARYRDANVL